MHSVLLEPGAGPLARRWMNSIWKTWDAKSAPSAAAGIRAVEPAPETRLMEGDVVVVWPAGSDCVADERLQK